MGVIPKSNLVPNLVDGTLWYNEAENELLQGFGGIVSGRVNSAVASASSGLSLWALRLNSLAGSGRNGSWHEVLWAKHSAFANVTRPHAGLSAFAGDSAYVLGGVSSGQDKTMAITNNMPLPGLVHYNMTSRQFSNHSATQYYGTGTAQRGQMLHVPVYGSAQHGLFVVLGGYSSDMTEFTLGHGHLSLANITVYDLAANKWYWQTAQGDIPPPHSEYCAAGAKSTNGTYEIFIYGGWSGFFGDDNMQYSQVWALSLPAFHWFRVYNASSHARVAHTCHIVGQRQLLSIGGADVSQVQPVNGSMHLGAYATRDHHSQGLATFDITSLNWTAGYDAASEPYEQSKPVAEFYQKNLRYPPQWDTPALRVLMDPSATVNASTASSPSSTASSASCSTSASSGRKVAGGVVGGAAGLLLVALLAFLLQKRRQRRKAITSYAPSIEMPDAAEADANNGPRQEMSAEDRNEPRELAG